MKYVLYRQIHPHLVNHVNIAPGARRLTGAASRYQRSDDLVHTIATAVCLWATLNLISGLS